MIVIIEARHLYELHTKFCPTFYCQCHLHMQRKLLGIISVDFDATCQPRIIYSAFVKYVRKNGKYSEAVHKLLVDLNKAFDSVRRRSGIIFSLSLLSP
jgi:hypothetical protein